MRVQVEQVVSLLVQAQMISMWHHEVETAAADSVLAPDLC